VATVDSRTKISIDELVEGTVISGYVTPDGQLILVTRGGAEINAGNVGSQQPVGDQWIPTLTYVPGDVVSYAGALWKCLFESLGEPPSLVTRSWLRLSGEVTETWAERDPYFNGDDVDAAWDYTIKTGIPVVSFTSVTGEFESGDKALKIQLGPSESQRLYAKEENIVQGGDVITVVVRARLLSTNLDARMSASLTQNDETDTPVLGKPGSVETAAAGVALALTTSWETYVFEITSAETKPRAIMNLVCSTTVTGGATFLIDSIRIFRDVAEESGGGGAGYFFEQVITTATNPWIHVHGRGNKGVTVYTEDALGDEVEGNVSYPDNNTVQVDWFFDMTGTFRVFI